MEVELRQATLCCLERCPAASKCVSFPVSILCSYDPVGFIAQGPRGGTRLKQYKSKTEVCHQWQKSKTGSYGDACEFLNDSKAAVAHPKYEEPDPVLAAYTADEIQDYDNTWDGDYDDRDFEESADAIACAFTEQLTADLYRAQRYGKATNHNQGQHSCFLPVPLETHSA